MDADSQYHPKIHKQGTPVRPIVDRRGTPTYNIPKALSQLISPLLGHTDQHYKNTTTLAEKLKKITVNKKNDILISHDIISNHQNTSSTGRYRKGPTFQWMT